MKRSRRPDLTGGGLIRTPGGWTALKAFRRLKIHIKRNERILGDSDFVESVLEKQNERLERRYRIQMQGYEFEKDLYTHDEVFDEIRKSSFSLKEAAEYLEIAEITVRRWVKAGKLKFKRIGKNFVFDPDEIKAFTSRTLKAFI